jgi:NitT/TauT family transport system substrate-binding protein
MADARTTEGSDKVFGGTMSATVVYLKRDFLAANPNTVQALVNAFYQMLQWMQQASPEQIADSVPQEYWLGDKALYLAASRSDLQVYSRDGVVSAGSRGRSLSLLQQLDKDIAAGRIDPAKTWDGRFVEAAAKR